MDIDLARQMVRAAFSASGELESMLQAAKSRCPAEEYRDLARGIAAAIDSIGTSLISKAIASHPQLEEEIDKSMNEHGRYLGSTANKPT